MKKKLAKKLRLSRETLQILEASRMRGVAGGAPFTYYCTRGCGPDTQQELDCTNTCVSRCPGACSDVC
jgi:hypothetical protein